VQLLCQAAACDRGVTWARRSSRESFVREDERGPGFKRGGETFALPDPSCRTGGSEIARLLATRGVP